MTSNQISYLTLLENRKHNRAMESNAVRELEEKKRSNLVNEEISRLSQQSTQQHYERQDAINAQHYERSDAETARSNAANEALKAAQNAETVRSNLANEQIKREAQAETVRHDIAEEAIGNKQAQASLEQSRASLMNASTNALIGDSTIVVNQTQASLNQQKERESQSNVITNYVGGALTAANTKVANKQVDNVVSQTTLNQTRSVTDYINAGSNVIKAMSAMWKAITGKK